MTNHSSDQVGIKQLPLPWLPGFLTYVCHGFSPSWDTFSQKMESLGGIKLSVEKGAPPPLEKNSEITPKIQF